MIEVNLLQPRFITWGTHASANIVLRQRGVQQTWIRLDVKGGIPFRHHYLCLSKVKWVRYMVPNP